MINGELKSRLDYGGYYVLVSPAGRVTIAQKYDEKKELELNLVGGGTYFVKLVGNSFWRATKYLFVEVSEQEALREIRKCRLMEPLKEGDECTGWKGTLPVCQFNPQR